jgi:hypothetical protein
MGTTSGPVRQRSPSLDSERPTRPMAHCPGRWSSAGILVLSGCLLACNLVPPVNPSSVNLSSDQQALVITSVDPAISERFTVKHLPTESKIAPGLYFHPKRFDLVQVSPDGRFAAFSTADHHTLVGLLNLATMAVQEIDVVTEGEVLSFHWTANGRMFVYDYLPASGSQRVRGYDLQSGERLAIPHTEHGSDTHLAFEQWGSQPREAIVSTRNRHTDEPGSTTIKLVSITQLAPGPKSRQ